MPSPTLDARDPTAAITASGSILALTAIFARPWRCSRRWRWRLAGARRRGAGSERWPTLRRGASPPSPLAVLLALLSLWAGLSAWWSPIPAHSLFEAGRLLVIAGAGLIAVGAGAALTASDTHRLGRATIIGVAAAIALLQFERWSGGAVLRLVHRAPLDPAMLIYRYDRGVTFLLLAAWPAAVALAARQRIVALLIGAAIVAITLVAFKSQTAVLAGAVGVVATLAAWRLPRAIACSWSLARSCWRFVFPLVAPGGAVNRADPARTHRRSRSRRSIA